MNGTMGPSAAFEGRIIAHRKVLARLIRAVRSGSVTDLDSWLENRATFHDSQEDPGSVPSEGLQLELALADEIALLLRLSRAEE